MGWNARRRLPGTKENTASQFLRTALLLLTLLGGLALPPRSASAAGPRLIKIVADKDNKFKVPGQKQPVMTLKENEVVLLRITSHKGTEWAQDGAVHSFTVKELKDQGWDLRLKEGTQEFTLVAPPQPGEYVIECTVKCGEGHDDMKMKLIVTP